MAALQVACYRGSEQTYPYLALVGYGGWRKRNG
jgi:hypothetical protein